MRTTTPALASLAAIAAIYGTANAGESARLAAEQGFTIAPGVQTPVVLKTEPNAACDLKSTDTVGAARSIRIYANGDGYVRVHVAPRKQSQADARLILQCAAAGKVTTYPIHLRADWSSTPELPAPQTQMPIPAGSIILSALNAEAARRLSDQDLRRLGYPMRPDAITAPAGYAKWLERVSEPLTVVPAYSVSRSDIAHAPANITANSTAESGNWCGYVGLHAARSYMGVYGEWIVPRVRAIDPSSSTHSSFWVGLDGYNIKDLVQAGTESNDIDTGGFYVSSYHAWTELLPNQPTERQITSLSPEPGDEVTAEVWVGDADGAADPNGTYGIFEIVDWTQRLEYRSFTALAGTHFDGEDVEWIMERPTMVASTGSTYSLLSDYGSAEMFNAYALGSNDKWVAAQTTSNQQVFMLNEAANGNDNNLLSSAELDGPTYILFYWYNFH